MKLPLLLFTGVALIGAADNPFAGKWKLDPEKSDFAGTTIRFEPAENGGIRYTKGMSYVFRTDGGAAPGFFGRTISFRQLSPDKWERVTSFAGRTLNRATFVVDKNDLTVTLKGTKPNGVAFENEMEYERQGAGDHLMGTWRRTSLTESAPDTIEFTPGPDNRFTYRDLDAQTECEAALDGRDYPLKGPEIPVGLTLAFTRSGDRAIEVNTKLRGDPVLRAVYTVASDGKTLIENASRLAANEPIRAVYVRP